MPRLNHFNERDFQDLIFINVEHLHATIARGQCQNSLD